MPDPALLAAVRAATAITEGKIPIAELEKRLAGRPRRTPKPALLRAWAGVRSSDQLIEKVINFKW